MKDSFSYLLPDEFLKSMASKDEQLFLMKNGKKIRLVYDDFVFDQNEYQKIQEFKNYAMKHNFDANNLPDNTLMRYLYSYDFEPKETLEKLKIYLNWYSDLNIQRQDQVTLDLINQGTIYTYGRDKSMRPIIFLNVGMMDMEKYTLNDYLAAINQVVNLVLQKLFIKGTLENYMFVINMGNKGIGSLPLGTVKEIVLKLSYIYSMRMGRLLIINCNTFVKIMYSAICPFLAEITKEKIKILSSSEVQKGRILQYIDPNQLEKIYGGNLSDLSEKWPPRIPGKQFKPTKKYKSVSNENQNLKDSTELQETYGENHEIMKACCSTKQCVIY